MTDQNVRKRSTSTLANTISFNLTRGPSQVQTIDDESEDEQRSPMLTHHSAVNRPDNTSPHFYSNRNVSSSTVHSITHTLSNVGFTSVLPNSANSNLSDSSLSSSSPSNNNNASPTIGKMENALNRAKLFAKTKTKELQKKTKNDIEKSYHHQHQNFLKKTGHSGLSSSSSTSKVADSGNTLYSFDPLLPVSDEDAWIKQATNEAHIKTLNFEEKDNLADEIWTFITDTVSPIFKMKRIQEGFIKTPIEDLNQLVVTYLKLQIENAVPASVIIGEIQEFLRVGFNVLDNDISLGEDIERGGVLYRIIVIWRYFLERIYFYLLAIFTPLETELKGKGPILKESAGSYWADTIDIGTFSSSSRMSTTQIILCSFREFLLLPYFDAEISVPDYLPLQDLKTLTQCFGMVKSVNSSNYSQRIVDHIFELILKCNPVE